MKPIMQFVIPIFTISLLSACTTNSDVEKTNNNSKEPISEVQPNTPQVEPPKNESTQPMPATTQAEVLDAINTDLKTDLPKLLPSEVPLEQGKYLTAKTKSYANSYEVIFYESDEQIALNHETIQDGQIIARLSAQKYESVQEASEQIAFENFSELGGQPIDLGYGITGYQDAGAGSMWTSWNEGRWAIAAHTRTSEGERGIKLAKEATEFLETHTLPIPKPNGSAHIDVYQSDNRITWQKENIVYMIDKVKDPMNALKIATSIE
ncbi:hypothetical protein [Bacillus sp. FJAT-22090]|uniref:hypothetical protein n=1 Tax=Bacillus sp. FJAT-22090 TaxID=1581038 RepID=UPI0011A03DBD|nr:hypothetical protein [Bacillus sp. FJAT-22090]